MRSLQPVLTRILHWTGLNALARRLVARRGRLVIELHGIPARPVPDLPPPLRPCLWRDDLETILRWLKLRFHLLTPDEFLAAEIPGVLLTFDDGFRNQAEVVVPLLERFGAPAVLFVTTRHVVEPTDWLPFVHQLMAEHGVGSADQGTLHEVFDGMSRGLLADCANSPVVTIGSHTVDHPFLTRLDDETLRHQLTESKRLLEAFTGSTVDLLAYPTGDYDARVAAAARAAGYRAAFVEDSRQVGAGDFEIPRIGLYRSDSPYLGVKLGGLHRRPLPLREAG